jgi:hypothetical protein
MLAPNEPTVLGMDIDVRLVQFWKHLLPMESKPLDNVIVFRLEQPRNADA